ncbi:MAG: ABC transporter substrate-binding protein [Myxococcales bacterium]|nr:ABC transporter substrate-binding protein [Myxococcales bacterium]
MINSTLAFLIVAISLTTDQATQTIQDSINEVIVVLSDPELQGVANRSERYAKMRSISGRVMDWTKMAQRSLGVHWRSLKPVQRARFTKTFREILASHYLGQLDRFQGKEIVEHTGTEKSNNNYIVSMKLVTPSRAWVPFAFYLNPKGRVFDVSIEGVSISNHYRGTFGRMLANGSFENMMKKLERKLATQKRVEAISLKRAKQAAAKAQ